MGSVADVNEVCATYSNEAGLGGCKDEGSESQVLGALCHMPEENVVTLDVVKGLNAQGTSCGRHISDKAFTARSAEWRESVWDVLSEKRKGK